MIQGYIAPVVNISESSSEYENFSEDKSSLSRKCMRMQSEEEGEISEENCTEKISDSGLKLSEGNSKIDKLKKTKQFIC